MKYIYTRSQGLNEVIEATMEKPKPNEYNIGEDEMKYYTHDMIEWEQHLSTAPRYKIEGEIPDWKEGDELIEGKDFTKQHQLKWNDGWEYECKSVWDKVHDCGDKRIVAISIYQSQCTCNFVTEYLKGKADCPVHDIEDSGGMIEEETQDELWEDVENISIFNDNPKILLATKFYITRKP